jgi:hypothetical protein
LNISAKPAGSSAAVRKRRYRRRRAAGRILLRVEASDYELTLALIKSGYLAEAQSVDRHAVEAATAKVLPDWVERWLSHRE